MINALRPQNARELKPFLGLLSYYSKFVPNRTSILAPLYKLLRKNAHWRYSTKEENAFFHANTLLTSSPVLGIGVVLIYLLPDRTENPIGYASSAERNHSQFKKEGLSLVFRVNKFHAYLFGHNFLLCTDHKPWLTMFNEHRSTYELFY